MVGYGEKLKLEFLYQEKGNGSIALRLCWEIGALLGPSDQEKQQQQQNCFVFY